MTRSLAASPGSSGGALDLPPPPPIPLEAVREIENPVASARAAGLRYVDDRTPGIRRRRAGKYFSYTDPSGRPVRDPQVLARIKALGIPPAWTDVWICPDPRGHVQATGRDARGRKQYRYHPRWRAVRDDVKFGRMLAFARALPTSRARVERDLALPGLPRHKVLATVVRLLETTLIRVGNEEYARSNDSYGLTTLRSDHVEVEGPRVRFEFRGKSGKHHEIEVHNRKLASIVRRCKELPGWELFGYVDADGTRQTVDSADVNDYLREITGEDFSAKDFRTWSATVLASLALQECEALDSEAGRKKNVVGAIKQVAQRLGNTPAVCRKSYIHPAILEAYVEGSFAAFADVQTQKVEQVLDEAGPCELRPEERRVLELLQARLEQEAGKPDDDLEELLAKSIAAA